MKEIVDAGGSSTKRNVKFVRHAAHRKKKLGSSWRRPRGLQNKLRLRKKSRGVVVSTGFRSSSDSRGLSHRGKRFLLIRSVRELSGADPKLHELIIASSLGNKKRLLLLEEASKMGFAVSNFDPASKIEAIKSSFDSRRKSREEHYAKKDAKDAKKRGTPRKADKQSEVADASSSSSADDDARKKELRKREKILTKRDQ